MGITGWFGAEEPERSPGFTDLILANRPALEQRGSSLQQTLARAAQAPDRDDPELDPDDRMAAMVTRGYNPGAISQLSMRLGDTLTELAGEREKLERGARRAEQVMQAHQAGRIRAWDIPQLLGDDDGDPGRVEQLQRRAASLQQQIDAASEAATPPQPRQLSGIEAASRAGHELFREVTRARMADLEAGRPAKREPRPFDGRGVAVRSEVTCADCINVGATAEQSFLIHQDPDAPIETELVGLSEKTLAAFGRLEVPESERHAYAGAEIYR